MTDGSGIHGATFRWISLTTSEHVAGSVCTTIKRFGQICARAERVECGVPTEYYVRQYS
jgi:hypothetical protein